MRGTLVAAGLTILGLVAAPNIANAAIQDGYDDPGVAIEVLVEDSIKNVNVLGVAVQDAVKDNKVPVNISGNPINPISGSDSQIGHEIQPDADAEENETGVAGAVDGLVDDTIGNVALFTAPSTTLIMNSGITSSR